VLDSAEASQTLAQATDRNLNDVERTCPLLPQHPAYVIYVIAGGKFRNHSADGTVTEAEFRTGDVIYRDPITHWAENIGSTTIRLELVELKN